MTQPQRRRPGSTSPIKLVPAVEPVQTPSPATTNSESPAATRDNLTPSPQVAPETPPAQTQATTPASSAPAEAPDTKAPVTVTMYRSTKKRAETAVFRTAGFTDGYTSFSALVEGAIQRELERLAELHNGGEPFEPNSGSFRQGRPFSS